MRVVSLQLRENACGATTRFSAKDLGGAKARNLKHERAESVKNAFQKIYNMSLGAIWKSGCNLQNPKWQTMKLESVCQAIAFGNIYHSVYHHNRISQCRASQVS